MLALLLFAGEVHTRKGVLLVHELAHSGDRALGLQPVIRVAGGELVKLRHAPDDLAAFAEGGLAAVVEDGQYMTGGRVLAEVPVPVHPNGEVLEEVSIHTAAAEERQHVLPGPHQEGDRVGEGIEHIRWEVVDEISRHHRPLPEASTSSRNRPTQPQC